MSADLRLKFPDPAAQLGTIRNSLFQKSVHGFMVPWSFVMSSYAGPADIGRIAAMIASSRSRSAVAAQAHVGNFAWRLASADLTKPYDDLALWSNKDDRVVAIALVYDSYPIDLLIAPDLENPVGLLEVMLDWAEDRWRMALAKGNSDRPLRVGCLDSDELRSELLRRRGYMLGDRRYMRFGRGIDAGGEPLRLPDGLRARTIERAADADRLATLHNEIFGSPVLGVDDVRRVINVPWYKPELGLVVENDTGKAIAFALGWLDPIGATLEFEPVGCLAAWRRRGITGALLREIMRRAAHQDARMATVTARANNAETMAFYYATGFERQDSESEYRKDLGPVGEV